ncbi:MAG: 16S rRNA (guanine(527)-N(7))-methyltransferase RsmG [Alloprevotella sp.]|nr:16S rRNA (guanine(527)-N(7))-methyltransferase RsmG [Alloprevotella sp.]
MQTVDIIFKYFPELTEPQRDQFRALEALYQEWNAKINVISRKDIGNLYEHHVLHSLGIAKFVRFRPGTRILDVGTGGGFPGLPLAILYPEVRFRLIDSIGKKVRVAAAIAESAGLGNVETAHMNVLEEHGKYDFIVSRAVMATPELVRLVRKNVAREQRNALPNGLICLKGGELGNELRPFRHCCEVVPLEGYFSEEFFETKKVVYIQL